MATYTLISSNILSTTALSVTLSSIPATYTDLVIRVNARTSETINNELLIYRFNGNSGANYSTTTLIGNASTVVSNQPANQTNIRLGWENGANSTSNTFSSAEIYIPNYLANQKKPTDNFSVQENMTNSTAAIYINANAGLSQITDPITSVTISSINDVLFVAGSSFYLYGVFRGPETLPSTPTIGTATATGATTATVAFTPTSATNVDASYTALSTPGSITATGTSSPLAITGLTTGTAYTFQVRANNPGGSSAYSSASNSITPSTAFESIASYVGTGSATSFTFSSIPSTYKHLQIRAISRNTAGGGASANINIRFNGDTGTSYYAHFMESYGSGSIQSATNGSLNYLEVQRITQGSAAQANYMGVGIIDIIDYSLTTKNTTVKCHTGVEDNNTIYSTTDLVSGVWFNTAAVNSITIIDPNSRTFNTQTVYALYGIRG